MPRANRGGSIQPTPDMHNHGDAGGMGAMPGQVPAANQEMPAPPSAPPEPMGPIPAGAMGGLASPTNRPQEPITAGIDERAMQRMQASQQNRPQTGQDFEGTLRALYSIYPHPDIERLLR